MSASPPARAAALLLLALALSGHLPAAGPQLVWNDEFNGPVASGPDPSKWDYDLGVGTPAGWGNHELETYTDSRSNSLIVADPLATDGRALAIRALAANGGYTSARLKTDASFTFTYGRLEARARVPAGVGCWPAFWALGADAASVGWPACGEIDVMEWVGQTPTHIKGSLHATGYSGGNSLNADSVLPGNATYSDAYHTFAVDRYPDQIVFSRDGVVYEVRKKIDIPAGSAWPFDTPFYVILNFAIGGDWPGPPNAGTVFPQDYRVDYVRVYSLPATAPASLVWAPSAPQAVTAVPAAAGITVAWQAPQSTFGSAITGYSVQRATDAAFTQNLTVLNPGTATSYADPTAQKGTAYYYRVTATSADGTSEASAAATASALVAGPNARLLNLAARGYVGTGSNALIGGFVVGGPDNKTVLIRASGPAIAASPFNVSGTLPDPELQLFSGSSVMANNAGWGGDPRIETAAAAVSAFAWSNPASADSALLLTLAPGAYTAVVSGAAGDTGVSLLEVYDAP